MSKYLQSFNRALCFRCAPVSSAKHHAPQNLSLVNFRFINQFGILVAYIRRGKPWRPAAPGSTRRSQGAKECDELPSPHSITSSTDSRKATRATPSSYAGLRTGIDPESLFMRQAQLARGVVNLVRSVVPSDIPFSDPVPRGGSLRIPRFRARPNRGSSVALLSRLVFLRSRWPIYHSDKEGLHYGRHQSPTGRSRRSCGRRYNASRTVGPRPEGSRPFASWRTPI